MMKRSLRFILRLDPTGNMLLKISALLFIFSIFTVAAKAQDFVGSVRMSLDRGSLPEAEAKLQEYRSARGVTAEYLEAYSWLGRYALAQKQYTRATKLADQTYAMIETELKKRALDAEPRIPTALGAAIEVKALAMAAVGERHEAVEYLRSELVRYGSTSMATRIRKNINLLSLEGKPAPALHETQYLGPKPQPLTALKGKPVIIFFWSHWCMDCKAEAPVLGRLKKEYGDGLAVVGPTQLYGYAAEGRPASPQQELAFIDYVRQKYLAILGDMPVPIASENFKEYGASTSPTLVLVGSDGRVKLYHPGRMTYDELKSQLEPLVTVNR
jgi:thiol-disulfide isomerase/thioredoxin